MHTHRHAKAHTHGTLQGCASMEWQVEGALGVLSLAPMSLTPCHCLSALQHIAALSPLAVLLSPHSLQPAP